MKKEGRCEVRHDERLTRRCHLGRRGRKESAVGATTRMDGERQAADARGPAADAIAYLCCHEPWRDHRNVHGRALCIEPALQLVREQHIGELAGAIHPELFKHSRPLEACVFTEKVARSPQPMDDG